MKKRKSFWLVRLLALVLACSFAFTFASGSAPAAHAEATSSAVLLGGMDLMGYCRSQGYISVRTVGTTYYDWRCIDRNGNDVSFSMRSACQWQYHTVNAWDRTWNFYSATNGECWQGNVFGGMNARWYCQNILGYQDVTLLANNAYGWSCVTQSWGGPTYHVFTTEDMDELCNLTYQPNFVIARFDNFYTPTSWECIG